MRALLVLLVLFLAAGQTQALAAGAPRLDVKDYGLYAVTTTGRQEVPGIITNSVGLTAADRHLATTRAVPGRVGEVFGFRYVLSDGTVGVPEQVTVVMRYPPSGVRDPVTGKLHFVDRHTRQITSGIQDGDWYSLDTKGEIVSGKWTIEIWQGTHLLASQSFWIEGPEIS